MISLRTESEADQLTGITPRNIPFDRTVRTELGDDLQSRLEEFAMDYGALLSDEVRLRSYAEEQEISVEEAIKGLMTTLREVMMRLTNLTGPFVPVQQFLMSSETGNYNVTFRGDSIYSPVNLQASGPSTQVPYVLGERPWASTLEGPQGTF